MTRVLVVHARGGVGDVVLSTPVIEALHRGLEKPEITMLVRSGASGVVEANPFLTDLIVVQEGQWDQGSDYRKLIADVRRRRYDIGVVLWSKAPEAWLLKRAGIPIRVGQDGRILYSFLYTHRVKILSESGDTTTHWVDIQLAYAGKLNLPTEGLIPTLVVRDRGQAEAWLPDGPSYIGFSVGKGLTLAPERWPTETFAHFAEAVSSATGATIVLTGAPGEIPVVQAVAQQLRCPYIDLTGKTSLTELAAVIDRCQAFVCPDSGPMHMAAALGVPTVGIFAMACEFPDRWRPYGDHCILVRPTPVTCPVGCQKETCATFSCYRAVQPAEVVAAVQKVIGLRVRK